MATDERRYSGSVAPYGLGLHAIRFDPEEWHVARGPTVHPSAWAIDPLASGASVRDRAGKQRSRGWA